MDKHAYSRLIHEWDKHKKRHVRSKFMVIIGAVALMGACGYFFLVVMHSNMLLLTFVLIITLRCFFLAAKGDRHDLASQLGLQCWNCGNVFDTDSTLKDVMDSNACPRCQHAVYEDSSG